MQAGRPHMQVRITGPAVTVQSYLYVVKYHLRTMFGPGVCCRAYVISARHPGELRALVTIRREGDRDRTSR